MQDFSAALREMVSFPVIQLKEASEIEGAYQLATNNMENGISTILVEYKDLV